MKYRANAQDTFHTIGIKALDSMPVGTQVEYTGTAIPNGWEQVNDYSTTEMNTGKRWIDGKTIYRKTFTGNLPNSNSDTTFITLTTGTNVIEMYGYAKGGSTTSIRMPINSYHSSDWVLCIYNDGIYIKSRLGNEFKNGEYCITLEYTKTTD